MKNENVVLHAINLPIAKCPGFKKKELADRKLDLMGLCGFGCLYCSSNEGNFLRIRREEFAKETERQLGRRILPKDNPSLSFVWDDIMPRLCDQLANKPPDWGQGETLVMSMLTDPYSPWNVAMGTTRASQKLVVARTGLRTRVLTKSAIVGTRGEIEFFLSHPGRFVVQLSIGTLDDTWAHRVERGTSKPSARVRALHRLQDAGVQTSGMLCPVFPDVLQGDGLERLVAAIRPEKCETVWAEPYNDRNCWEAVRSGYGVGSFGHAWMTAAYERHNPVLWSDYASHLYERLSAIALRDGWVHKLRYLLYEHDIQEQHAWRFEGLRGVLLQGKPQAGDGPSRSRNPHIAALQAPAQ